MSQWFVRQLGGEPRGPYATEQIAQAVEAGQMGVDVEVCPAGGDSWLPIDMVDEFSHLTFIDGDTRVVQSPWFNPNGPPSAVPPSGGTAPYGAPRPAAGAFPNPRPAAGAPRPDYNAPPPPPPADHRAPPPPGGPRPLGATLRLDHSPAADPRGANAPGSGEDLAVTRVAPPQAEAGAGLVETRVFSAPAHLMVEDVATQIVQPTAEMLRAARRESLPDIPVPDDEVHPAYDDVDDETMTRVARPPDGAPRGLGVLPTLNMDRRDLPAVRPAAGAPSSKNPVLPAPPAQPPGLPAIGSDPFAAAAPPLPTPPSAHLQHVSGHPSSPYSSAPPNYAPPTHHPAPQTAHPREPAAGGDAGIKILIGVIVLLGLGLAVVLALLVLRR